jgi:serine/threonine protein phosphatase PrpC
VGFHGPVEPDTSTRVLNHGDLFIMCSDGLTDVMDDADILRVSTQNPPDMVADALVEEALAKGTNDNVTAVVVSCLQ